MWDLADIIEERAFKLGLQQGRLEGREEGRLEGREEGREEGEILGLLTAIKALMQTNNCSVLDAMKMIKIKEEDYIIFEKLLSE